MSANPFADLEARIRECEAANLANSRTILQLSAALTQQAQLLSALLGKLGESADTLPGENAAPLDPATGEARQRHGRVKPN
jgi:uncharacterized coiled-coil protein SlyX